MIDKFYKKFGALILAICVTSLMYHGFNYSNDENIAGVIWCIFGICCFLFIKVKDFNEPE